MQQQLINCPSQSMLYKYVSHAFQSMQIQVTLQTSVLQTCMLLLAMEKQEHQNTTGLLSPARVVSSQPVTVIVLKGVVLWGLVLLLLVAKHPSLGRSWKPGGCQRRQAWQEVIFVSELLPCQLQQCYVPCDLNSKPLLLLHFMLTMKFTRVLCFTNSREASHR